MKEKVDEIVRPLVRILAVTFAGTTILLMGVFHLSVGAVKYLSVVFGSEAVAYSLVGIFMVLAGIILLLTVSKRYGHRKT